MRWAAAALLAACLLLPAAAQANGALPATTQVLLPPAAPDTLIVATNFGLVTSSDGGARWRWTCEHDLGSQGSAYQLAAPPGVRLLALATDGLVTSADLGCGWSLVMGHDTGAAFDYFPDPVDPDRALALTVLNGVQRALAVVELRLAPGAPATRKELFRAPDGEDLSTVEIARADPKVVYATLVTPSGTAPARLAHSEDGGATWAVISPAPPRVDLKILAVDTADPRKLYFRVPTGAGDELAISEDGGQTLRSALAPEQVMSTFVRLASGHVIGGWVDIDRGYLQRSSDGGATFTLLPTRLHPQALAERGGKLYMATDAIADGQALVVSEDEGQTWKRVLGLEDVTASEACPAAASACASWCQILVSRSVFPRSVCGAAAPDAAAPDASATTDAGPVEKGGGCSCRVGGGAGGLPVLLALLALLRARRR